MNVGGSSGYQGLRLIVAKLYSFKVLDPAIFRVKSDDTRGSIKVASIAECVDPKKRALLLDSIGIDGKGELLIPKRAFLKFVGIKPTLELEGGKSGNDGDDDENNNIKTSLVLAGGNEISVPVLKLPTIPLHEVLQRQSKPVEQLREEAARRAHELLLVSTSTSTSILSSDKKKKKKHADLTQDEQLLFKAAREGNFHEIAALLSRGTKVDCVHPHHGGSPLHLAAAYGNLESVKMLINYGAKINCQAFNDSIPLHWASGAGRNDITQFLLEKGSTAEAKTSTWHNTVSGAASGQAPLHWAADAGHDDVVETIVDHDAASLGLMDEREKTPLDLATSKEREDTSNVIERRLHEEYVHVAVNVEMVVDTSS